MVGIADNDAGLAPPVIEGDAAKRTGRGLMSVRTIRAVEVEFEIAWLWSSRHGVAGNQFYIDSLKLGFVVARVPSNEIGSYRPIFAELQRAVENVKRGEVIHVVNPQMRAWRGGHGIKPARRA